MRKTLIPTRQNELSDEMLKCASYYGLVNRCFAEQADATMKKNIDQYQQVLTSGAVQLAGSIGLLDATNLARTELHMKALTNKIGGDCRNISILLNEIGDSCHKLASDPKPRFDELLAEKKRMGTGR